MQEILCSPSLSKNKPLTTIGSLSAQSPLPTFLERTHVIVARLQHWPPETFNRAIRAESVGFRLSLGIWEKKLVTKLGQGGMGHRYAIISGPSATMDFMT